MKREVTYCDFVDLEYAASEESFNENLLAAQAVVDSLVGLNDIDDESAYIEAVCAAVEARRLATSQGSSISIGSFSTSGLETNGSPDSAARNAALAVLSTTGMLFAGLR